MTWSMLLVLFLAMLALLLVSWGGGMVKVETHSLVATIVLTLAILLGVWTSFQNQKLINSREDAVNRIEAMVKDIHTKVGAGKAP